MCLRLPPTTNITDSVGLMERGYRSTTPQSSRTLGLASENILINILSEEEVFFFTQDAMLFHQHYCWTSSASLLPLVELMS